MGRIAGRFRRRETRATAKAFVTALLSSLPSKNCWTLSEQAGDATPDRMQHLLARASWDDDGVRDDLRGFVAERLGTAGAVIGKPESIVIDATEVDSCVEIFRLLLQ
ncbi:transposase [Nocardia sp. NBC_00565]|uniref:transposase n=1 Tax=Nocardia sp. NBC_00565 TaxID=2975993 RepID=UPI003FA5B95C